MKSYTFCIQLITDLAELIVSCLLAELGESFTGSKFTLERWLWIAKNADNFIDAEKLKFSLSLAIDSKHIWLS